MEVETDTKTVFISKDLLKEQGTISPFVVTAASTTGGKGARDQVTYIHVTQPLF